MQEKLSSQHLVSDLSFFHQKLPQRHIDLFHTTSQRVFDQMVSRVMTKIKRKPLQRYEFAIEVQKILASMKESHTRIWINHAAHSDEYAPILFQWLQDGYYIMAIQKEFYQYVGNKLIGIHDTPLKKIISLLEPLISAENDKSYTAEIPSLLTSGTLQKHLKIVPKNSKKILYKTENLFGQKQDISLDV